MKVHAYLVRTAQEALTAGEPVLHILCYYLVKQLRWRRQEQIKAQARYRARLNGDYVPLLRNRKVDASKLVNLDQY